MILAIDTSSANCSVALLAADGAVIARHDELIGRGHAEHLMPIVRDLIGARVPSTVVAGVGPGSFTGIRVGLAAAQGLAIGWSVPILGVNSLALLAAADEGSVDDGDTIAAAILGGHGELFVQSFRRRSLDPLGPPLNLPPALAAQEIDAALVIGNGATALVAARGFGRAIDDCPSAARLGRLPNHLRSQLARPLYVRAPDARPAAA